MGHDVFISHSTKDKAAADAVCAALESSGIRCWIAPRDIKPGKIWAASIMQGINQSRLMVLVFSAHANLSKHVGREVERADTRGIPILTLRIQDVMPHDDLEYFLSNSQWSDALTPPLQSHLPEFVQLVQASLPPRQDEAGQPVTAAPPAPTADDAREQWVQFVDAIPVPALSDILLPAWTVARDRFRDAGGGDEADVRTRLTQLGEGLAALDQALAARSEGLSPELTGPAAARRTELLQKAVDVVNASPSAAELPDETRATLESQFSAWVSTNDDLESARTAFAHGQLDTALTTLDHLTGLEDEPVLQRRADDLRDEIRRAQQTRNDLRNTLQAAVDNKQWAVAWKTVDALDHQTGRQETQLRDQIVDGLLSAAEAEEHSGAWKAAIDLLTQFGRLGDGGDASLQKRIVADLLKAAGSKAHGDATARRESLGLLNQLDRVSAENVKAADLRRQIEGKDCYENAAARIKAGAFQEAADHYQKASERSCPGSAERLSIARALVAADALLTNDQAAVEQLETALNSLGALRALTTEEQAQANSLSKKVQSVLARKKAQQTQGNLRSGIQAAIDGERWMEAWNTVDALDEQTGGKETQLRDEIANGVVSTAKTRGDSGTWRVAIDLLTLFGRLWVGDRRAASLREKIVADLLKAAGSKADGNATSRQEALDLLSQLDRVSKANARAEELRRQIEGKGYYEHAAAKIKEGTFLEAADHYQKASERACPGAAERLLAARVLAAADALLKSDKAALGQLEVSLQDFSALAAKSGFSPDEQAQATELSRRIESVLAQKRAQQAQSDLLKAVQAAVENKQWAQAWKSVDALDQRTGRKETQLRDQIVNGIVSAAEMKSDSGAWTVAIDLLTQFGRLGDADKGAVSLRERIVADLLKAAGSKADGDEPARQEALNLLSQLDPVARENVKAAELRRQIEGKGHYENAAASIKAGAFQEAVDHYQKAGERSHPGARERLQMARVLVAADTLSKNDQGAVEQLESALKSLATPAFNPDEQAQAIGLGKKIQSVLAKKKAQQTQNELRNAIQAAVNGKRWLDAWNTVDALDRQTGGKEAGLRDQIVNGVVSTAATKGDSGTWKIAIDLLTQFGRLGDSDGSAASLRERIVADLLSAAGSKADGDATARQEALDLLSQLDRVSKGNVKAADLRRQIEGRGHYENAAARMKAGAFQEAADHYQKAGERSHPGAATRLQIARVLSTADALLNSDKAAVEQLETALHSLGAAQALNADELVQATSLSKKIQSVLARKKAQQAQSDLLKAVQAAIAGKQWAQAWTTVDALDQQTGGKEPQLRDQIVNGVVNSAETNQDSGTWKAAIDLLTQFGRLGDADKGAAALRDKIAAALLKAAKSKADGDAAARQEALNLLSQIDRVSRGHAKAADLRRQIEGKGHYETAAARIKAGAFQEAADNYQKAIERSYPGTKERLQAARVLAAADALVKNDKAAVEQHESALKGLTSTSGFNSDEQAQARTLGKRIQSVLATKYFELADGQERATPPNFGAAVSHYRKSAGYGRQDASVRQQAAQQLVDVQKLKGPAALKEIDDIDASLNDAERSFATSLRSKLAATLEQRPQKSSQPEPAASVPLRESGAQQAAAKTLAPTLEERRREIVQTLPVSVTVPVETARPEVEQPVTRRRVPGWAKIAVSAAGLAACAAGVIAYQHQRPGSTVPRNGDNLLVAGTGVPAATLQPVNVGPGSEQHPSVNLPATTGPAAAPHDGQKQWAQFVGAIPIPTLSNLLLPAWTAARDGFRGAAPGNEADVRTQLTQLGDHLNALDRAIVAQSQGLTPALASAAAAKREQLLQQAVDAVKASPSGAEFPDDARSKLQTQFTQWVAQAKVLDAAQVAFSQHQNEAALAKLDELKQSGTDADLLRQAEQLRGEIQNAMKMAKDADFEKNVNAAVAKGDFATAVTQLNALAQNDSSYQGLTSLQQSIASAEGNAVKGAEALWQQKKDADALNTLGPMLALAPPPDAAVQLKLKIIGAQKADLDAARVLLSKPDTAGAKVRVDDLLNRDPENAEAQALLNEIAKADEQQGNIGAALASYKELGNVHPLDAAKAKHVADLDDAKKLEDDARTKMSGQKWQLAANDLTDLGTRPGVASAASRLWPELENALLADAAAKGDAATWKTATDLLQTKGRLTDSLKQHIVDGLVSSADQQATAHNEAAALALLTQVDQLAPKNPGAAVVRKKITDAVNAKGHQQQIDAFVKSAVAAEQSGDFAAAAAAYGQASKLAPENAALAQQAQQEKTNATDAAALEGRARGIMNTGDPAAALKLINGAEARISSARLLTALGNEIKGYEANAQKNYQNGADALKRNVFSDAYMGFFLAACGGSPEGMLKLGDMIKDGHGVPKPDETMAKVWWKRSADLGNTEAKDRLNPKSPPGHQFAPGRS